MLIITIIVIVILAGSILLSIARSNSIKNAKKAVSENDLKVPQEAVTMWIGNRLSSEDNGIVGKEVGALYTGNGSNEINSEEYEKMKQMIVSMQARIESLEKNK